MPLFNNTSPEFNNRELNAVGSQYAADFNHNTSLLVEKATNATIFDASPQQFMDLKLLNMKQFKPANSDEFFFKEMGYQREPVVATGGAAAVSHPTAQTFAISDVGTISQDTIIVYPNNQKGVVTNVDETGSTVTVRPYTNGTLPAVVAGDEFGNHSPVEADGAEGFAQHFRAETIERHNFIQLFSKAVRYGAMELFKLQKQGTTNNFLDMERKQFFLQSRTDISNAFWNGEKGEVTLANNEKAKVTGGIFPSMVATGSPNAAATSATLVDAFEDIVFETEFRDYGETRFAFMTPRIHRLLSKAYKDEKTRYAPDATIALMNLTEINVGSSRIVLIPYTRFRSRASFPSSFENRIILLDMENINLRQTWAERSGETLDRTQGVPKLYKELWVDMNMGVEFNNPLACGWLDVIL